MRRGLKRTAMGCAVVLVLCLVILPFTGVGKAIRDFWHAGIIQAAISSPEDRKYQATREGNLKAMYTALMLYHDSEGQFPVASGWMDAIQSRIRTIDMSASEAQKKLIRPDLAGQPGAHGYSMNDLVSGKYKGDVKDPKTVLIFESADAAKNAHGSPAGQKRRMAITVSGSIVRL